MERADFGHGGGLAPITYRVEQSFAKFLTRCEYNGQIEWIWLKPYYLVYGYLDEHANYKRLGKLTEDQFTIFKMLN